MGMFDYVVGKVQCPKCGAEFEAEDQVKWTSDCFLFRYKVGEEIDAEDGEYDYGSWIRPHLISDCPKCHAEVRLKATVKNHILVALEPIGLNDKQDTSEVGGDMIG